MLTDLFSCPDPWKDAVVVVWRGNSDNQSYRTARRNNLTKLHSPTVSDLVDTSIPVTSATTSLKPSFFMSRSASVVPEVQESTLYCASLNLARTDIPIWGFRLRFYGFLRIPRKTPMGRINGSVGSTAEPQVGERQTKWPCQSNGFRAPTISSSADSQPCSRLHAGFGWSAWMARNSSLSMGMRNSGRWLKKDVNCLSCPRPVEFIVMSFYGPSASIIHGFNVNSDLTSVINT